MYNKIWKLTKNLGIFIVFSSRSMPGIYKIGMTRRTPEDRLRDANASNTWKPPTPYNIEMFVKVSQAYVKEQALHKLLEHYEETNTSSS